MKSSSEWAIELLAAQTAIKGTQIANCTTNTDVRFVYFQLGANQWGLSECNVWANENVSPPVCERFNVIQDKDNQDYTLGDNANYSDGVPEAGELELNLKKTWCHELGHVSAVRHHPDGDFNRYTYYDESTPDRVPDCMVRQHIESAADWLRYNDHHRGEINNRIS